MCVCHLVAVSYRSLTKRISHVPPTCPSCVSHITPTLAQQIVHQVRAKLYKFKKHEAAWGDMGVGVLRLMKHNTTDARRLVLRNDMGKVGALVVCVNTYDCEVTFIQK